MPSRGATVLRRGVGAGEAIRAASGALLGSAGVGHPEATTAASVVRRLARGRFQDHLQSSRIVSLPRPTTAAPDIPAPARSTSPAPASSPAGATAPAAAPASTRQASLGDASDGLADVAPIRRSMNPGLPSPRTSGSAPADRPAAEMPAPRGTTSAEPPTSPTTVQGTAATLSADAPVDIRRMQAGEFSRITGHWAAETLAGGSPSLAGLGVSMPDLMATQRVTDRAGEGPLASGFGVPAEIRPATGNLIGAVGSTARISQTAHSAGSASAPTLRRAFRSRVTSATGVPLLTPHLLAGAPVAPGAAALDAAFRNGAGATPDVLRSPMRPGASPSKSATPTHPATAAATPTAHAPAGQDHASPALRRSAAVRPPAGRGNALPGSPPLPAGAPGETIRRTTALRSFVHDDAPGPDVPTSTPADAYRGIAADDRSVLREHRQRLLDEHAHNGQGEGSETPSGPSGSTPAVRRLATTRPLDRQQALEEQIKQQAAARGPSAGYAVQAGRARAGRQRAKRATEAGKAAGKSGSKDMLKETEHLFVERGEDGAPRPRGTSTAPGSTTTGTSLTASTPAEAKPARGRRRLGGAELDRLVDRVIERIEQRVVDELERRGRRDGRGGF